MASDGFKWLQDWLRIVNCTLEWDIAGILISGLLWRGSLGSSALEPVARKGAGEEAGARKGTGVRAGEGAGSGAQAGSEEGAKTGAGANAGAGIGI